MKNQYFYLLTTLVLTVGCVNVEYKPDVVSRSDAQKQSYVIMGTIIDISEVTIEGDRVAGALAGGLIGGVAGKGVTDSDTESDIASLVGGLVGSAIGSGIGSSLTKKDAVELLIETEAGKVISIIQEVSSYSYKKNQKVRIIKRNGKSRVVPFD
ncbi:MAG: outer membrane lipoprotein SlyB [Gammaproteobacteria bacterium]|jgi:outer membrane lipoprotein SlyB|tara:strand:- start:1691 stop:2152 length:462 start_codon:yes stop_codon:yes gene_type:complete